MCNSDQCPITPRRLQLVPQHGLYPLISLIIHARRSLIQQHQFTLPNERPTQRQDLSLPMREVLPPRIHVRGERNALTSPMLVVGHITSREGRDAATVDECALQAFLGH